MFGRLVKRVTRQAAATSVQVAGSAAVAVGVGMLAGVAWAVIVAGVAALAFGTMAEVS
jgi:hypothetical protein